MTTQTSRTKAQTITITVTEAEADWLQAGRWPGATMDYERLEWLEDHLHLLGELLDRLTDALPEPVAVDDYVMSPMFEEAKRVTAIGEQCYLVVDLAGFESPVAIDDAWKVELAKPEQCDVRQGGLRCQKQAGHGRIHDFGPLAGRL